MAFQEPPMACPFPETDPPNPDYPTNYDCLPLPPFDYDFFPDDLTLPEGFAENLEFDGDLDDIDFTLDDIILPPENGGYVSGDGSDFLSWQNSKATDGSGVSSLFGGFDVAAILDSPSPETGSCNRGLSYAPLPDESAGCGSGFDGEKDSNSLSRDFGCCNGGQSGRGSPSPNSSDNASEIVVDQKTKSEEVVNGYSAKRKKTKEDCNTNPRSSKFRKSDNADTACPNGTLDEEEEKRKARLVRNRESAQLSRQRKKHHVDELEDKVRSMHSTIAELNSKISFFMAENASLRQQLSGSPGGGICPMPPGIYPPLPVAPMAYTWVPYASYPVRPQGSQVPLVPIPKLKPQHSTTKAKKPESKKVKTKIKKVASVSLLGVLFFMFLFGFLVPFVNVRYGVNEEAVLSGLQFSNNGVYGNHQGRVLAVVGPGKESDHNVGIRLCNGKSCLNGVDTKSIHYGSEGVESEVKQNAGDSQHLPLGNASEPLVASLYVPRNDKLVKIDGNLIIHSVLASEKAMKSSHVVRSEMKSDMETGSSAREASETGLAIAGKLPSAFGGDQAGRNVVRHPHTYRNLNDRGRALPSGSGDTYKDDSKLSNGDGLLQEWFSEGLAGPILSSGVCTEVYQFNVSPTSVNAVAIVPETSVANVTTENPLHSGKRKNRRILDRASNALARSLQNKTEEHLGRPSNGEKFQGNKSVSSVVVSVLVDPTDSGDEVISSGSFSRIFVVVLLDSVKYVTYSCVLPLKGSSPHLVTT